jgi:hypothetical protein
MKEIKDIREFEKLFSVNIPVYEHFEYYINTLMKSKEFRDLDFLISEYSDMEKAIEEQGFKSMTQYKMDYAFKRLLEKLKNSEAYKNFEYFDYSYVPLHSKDDLKNNLGVSLISFDLNKANYNIIKAFDTDGELSESWEHFCRDLEIHHPIALSKSFRQLVFGNLNPKRIQKTQHVVMMDFVDMLFKSGYINDDIVFISHDEVIIKNIEGKKFYNFSSDGFDFNIGWMTGIENKTIAVKSQIFQLDKLKDNKGFMKSVYKMENYGFAGMILMLDHKKLWSVPGDKYFMSFKKFILQEEIDERDLLFLNDGMKAKWVIE